MQAHSSSVRVPGLVLATAGSQEYAHTRLRHPSYHHLQKVPHAGVPINVSSASSQVHSRSPTLSAGSYLHASKDKAYHLVQSLHRLH